MRRVGGVLWGIHVCHTSVLHVRDFSCVVPRHSLRFFVSTVTVVVCTTGGLLFIFSKYQRQFGRAHLPGSVKTGRSCEYGVQLLWQRWS